MDYSHCPGATGQAGAWYLNSYTSNYDLTEAESVVWGWFVIHRTTEDIELWSTNV